MASALTGPIAAFNEIIGCTVDDPKVSQIARDVSATYTVWEDEELPDIHWIFEGKGLEFCFTDEILTAIFFQFIAEDGWNVGSWSGPLIDGFVAPDITPERADATFGEPEAIGCGSPTWRRYEIGDHFIHFDFREEGLHMITLLLETP